MSTTEADRLRMQLVEAGGQAAQELGLNRIQGQILVYLYLCDGAGSLDQIERSLGLSKAAVSIAARQLQTLGLLCRVWRTGDRRRYYRTADNLGQALRDGFVGVLRRKIEQMHHVLEATNDALAQAGAADDSELAFLQHRVERAQTLCRRGQRLLNNRLLRHITR